MDSIMPDSHHRHHQNRTLLLLLAAVVAAVGLVIVITAPHARAADRDLRDVVRRVEPAVVAVGTFQPTRQPPVALRGTGFSVGDGTMVLTNAHVVPRDLDYERRERIAVIRDKDGKGREMEVITPSHICRDDARDPGVIGADGPTPSSRLEVGPDGRGGTWPASGVHGVSAQWRSGAISRHPSRHGVGGGSCGGALGRPLIAGRRHTGALARQFQYFSVGRDRLSRQQRQPALQTG